MRGAHFVVACVPLIVIAACGSRGPLDINGVDYKPDSGIADASIDTGIDTGVDTGVVDAGRDGTSLVNCGQCVTQKCASQFLACFQSMACRDALQCAVMNCAGGMNGFDPQCLLQKCSKFLSGFGQLLPVVTCVTQNCGQDCLGVLGGMMDVVPPPDDN